MLEGEVTTLVCTHSDKPFFGLTLVTAQMCLDMFRGVISDVDNVLDEIVKKNISVLATMARSWNSDKHFIALVLEVTYVDLYVV